jgi:hypothetical protein
MRVFFCLAKTNLVDSIPADCAPSEAIPVGAASAAIRGSGQPARHQQGIAAEAAPTFIFRHLQGIAAEAAPTFFLFRTHKTKARDAGLCFRHPYG